MTKQIRAWLKAGAFLDKQSQPPLKLTPQLCNLSPLLANIARHGLEFELESYASKLPGHEASPKQALSFIRYADELVIMHSDKKVLEGAKVTAKKFLEPMGLKLNREKTTRIYTHVPGSGFTAFGFDVTQQPLRGSIRYKATIKNPAQKLKTRIAPSEQSIKLHKRKIRYIVRAYRGLSQARLIMKLNPLIKAWALSKKTQASSRVFQALDAYVLQRLWNWCTRRHSKMSGSRIKEKYFHKVKNRNWVFGTYDSTGRLSLELQRHSAIAASRHVKVNGNRSQHDGDAIY